MFHFEHFPVVLIYRLKYSGITDIIINYSHVLNGIQYLVIILHSVVPSLNTRVDHVGASVYRVLQY